MIEIKYIRLDEKLNDKVSIYALSEYMSSIKNSTYGWIGGFQNNKLVYILPYIKKKKFIFNFIQFQSETIKLEKDKLEEEKEFLNEVVNFFEKEKIDFISCPSQNALFKVIPDSVFQIYSCKFGSYVINLKLSEDKIWEKIHGKHKNVIRKAIKNGLIVKLENHNYEEIYNIIETTMKRSNLSIGSREFFVNQMESLKEKKKIFKVYDKNELQGVAVIIYTKFRAYYLYGGSIENPSLGAMNFLHWEAIKYFKGLGVEKYDFLGMRINKNIDKKLQGIQRFKSRFGCDIEIGYLWKVIFKKKKYILFEILKKLIKLKKYRKDIIDQEIKNSIYY